MNQFDLIENVIQTIPQFKQIIENNETELKDFIHYIKQKQFSPNQTNKKEKLRESNERVESILYDFPTLIDKRKDIMNSINQTIVSLDQMKERY